jgi:hypothetical protein
MGLTYFFEIGALVIGVASTILILSRNSKYLGNKLMAVATTLIGSYLFTIFLYDYFTPDLSSLLPSIFLKLGMIFGLIGGTLFFMTMQCMVNSTTWFSSKIRWVPYILIDIAAIIFFIAKPLIETFELNPNPDFYQGRVNVTIYMGPLIVMVALLFYYILFSIYYLQRYGIKKAIGSSKRKMVIFQTGLVIFVTAMFVNVASQFVSGSIGIILDVINLGMISIGMVFLAASLIYTPKAK